NYATRNLVLIFCVYFAIFFNRKCVTQIFAELINDGLTQQNAGTISSAQTISLALTTFLAGIYSHRLASRSLLTWSFILCSLTTGLIGQLPVSASVYTLLWFVNGIGQGLALPPILQVTQSNSTPTRFATNWAVVLISINVAQIASTVIAAAITDSYGWRSYILFSTCLTVGVGALSYFLINYHQDTVSNNDKKHDGDDTKKGQPGNYTLISPIILLTLTLSFIEGLSRIAISDWIGLYLTRQLQFTPMSASSFISLIGLGSIGGKLLAGKCSDILVQRQSASAQVADSSPYDGRPRARLPVNIVLFALNAWVLHVLCYTMDSQSSNTLQIVTALLTGVSISGNVVNLSVMATELGPKHMSGFYSSIVTMSSFVGGIFTGLPMSTVADNYGWHTVFVSIELLCLAAISAIASDSSYYKRH
ncbi:glucose-6-phosphate exchanger SLC37A4-like, partial [Oppia nitens]|uniref:glucose-6-phosphate exchanger SLC37A4-like n=1 Tax=Oppia nitens TaxID=1686743 RepID=UPI0023D9D676